MHCSRLSTVKNLRITRPSSKPLLRRPANLRRKDIENDARAEVLCYDVVERETAETLYALSLNLRGFVRKDSIDEA